MGRLENFEKYMDMITDKKEDTVNVLYALRIGASRTEKEALDVAIDKVEKNVLDAIRTEIAEDLKNADEEYRTTNDHMDIGICIGLKMALDTIDKHMKGEPNDNH